MAVLRHWLWLCLLAEFSITHLIAWQQVPFSLWLIKRWRNTSSSKISGTPRDANFQFDFWNKLTNPIKIATTFTIFIKISFKIHDNFCFFWIFFFRLNRSAASPVGLAPPPAGNVFRNFSVFFFHFFCSKQWNSHEFCRFFKNLIKN